MKIKILEDPMIKSESGLPLYGRQSGSGEQRHCDEWMDLDCDDSDGDFDHDVIDVQQSFNTEELT